LWAVCTDSRGACKQIGVLSSIVGTNARRKPIKKEARMARVSRAAAARHRNEAITAASRLFRERGVSRVGLRELSREVGLSHGFFYKQFASKDELVTLAVERAFEKFLEQRTSSAMSPMAVRRSILMDFLATGGRPNFSDDCLVAAFAADAYHAQGDPNLRNAFSAGLSKVVERAQSEVDTDESGANFLVDLAAAVGAVILARAADGSALADEILDATRSTLRLWYQ
jgi:TetR/AcrR family transcriptional repressor of nem operon